MSFWTFKKGNCEECFSELNKILDTLARGSEGFRGYMSLFLYDSPNLVTILTLWEGEYDDALKKFEQGVFARANLKVHDSLEIRCDLKIAGCFQLSCFSVHYKPKLPFLIRVDSRKIGQLSLGYFQVYRSFRVGYKLSDLFY
jgi:hypothetical protein